MGEGDLQEEGERSTFLTQEHTFCNSQKTAPEALLTEY